MIFFFFYLKAMVREAGTSVQRGLKIGETSVLPDHAGDRGIDELTLE